MIQTSDMPSAAAGILQLARLKSGLSQGKLGMRAGVPATMISAYERDLRQPTIPTLLRLLAAAGFDLHMKLEPLDDHDHILQNLENARTPSERYYRDQQQEGWRQAVDLDEGS